MLMVMHACGQVYALVEFWLRHCWCMMYAKHVANPVFGAFGRVYDRVLGVLSHWHILHCLFGAVRTAHRGLQMH